LPLELFGRRRPAPAGSACVSIHGCKHSLLCKELHCLMRRNSSAVPSGLNCRCARVPTLKRWATIGCPSGTRLSFDPLRANPGGIRALALREQNPRAAQSWSSALRCLVSLSKVRAQFQRPGSNSAVPSGLVSCRLVTPTLKTLGYYQASLRDEPGNPNASGTGVVRSWRRE
jgi:hypothetical protein